MAFITKSISTVFPAAPRFNHMPHRPLLPFYSSHILHNNAWILSQCQFGEHLLPLCPDLPVALVEAEKTAVICSAVFPEFLWLATGGLGQFNDRVIVLLGRQVIAFPDLGAYDRWRKKAKDYPLLDITVSDYLEKNATPQQREIGADLADLVVEMGGIS